MNGTSLPLQIFRDEFGFHHYLSDLASQSRAVLYSVYQSSFKGSLPEINVADEYQEYYEVGSVDTVRSLLRYCATENRSSAVILCDMALLSELMRQDLTDEIIHHVAISESSKPSESSDKNRDTTFQKPLSLPMNGWTLISSTAVGNCNRIILQKKGNRRLEPLGYRLN